MSMDTAGNLLVIRLCMDAAVPGSARITGVPTSFGRTRGSLSGISDARVY